MWCTIFRLEYDFALTVLARNAQKLIQRGIKVYHSILPNFQILMIAKINKTEISAKILKNKKIQVFIIGITPKPNQHMGRVRSFL